MWQWSRHAWLLALLFVGLCGRAASLGASPAGVAAQAGSGVPENSELMATGMGLRSALSGGGGSVGGLWPGNLFHHRQTYSQQNLQSVLASIEERLRALDALYSTRYSPRFDLGVDPQSRRLDGIESRLGRLETLLDLRLDKLTETISSHQLKDELAKEQLSRSVDATFERLHHRLGYLETRLDVALTKIQASMDSLSGRVERLGVGLDAGLVAGLGGRHGDSGGGLLDVKSGLEELRRSIHDNHQSLLNSTARAAAKGESAMHNYYERLSATLDHMQEDLNRTLTVQNDGGGGSGAGAAGGGGGAGEAQLRHERHIASNLLSAVERHAASFGSKVTNMYNELWRRTQILEGLSKDAMALSNATRRELQEGLRSVSMQLNRYCLLQSDKAKPSTNTLETIEVTLEEMRARLGSDLQTMISTQNLFLQSCHRIQENEPHLDKFIAQALEKMLGFINSNKCQSHMEEVHRLLKSHHSTVVRSIGHNTNTILRAANNSSKEARNLVNTMNEAHDGLLINTRDIQKSISGMQNEQLTVHRALGEITAVIKDLHDKLSGLANRSLPDGAYLKVIQCQSKTEENITSELKRIFEDTQKNISKEIHNLTQSILEMLRSIHTHIYFQHKESSETEPFGKNLFRVLKETREQDSEGTPENDITSEVHEENLNSIYDSQNPEIETSSVLQNLTNLNVVTQTNDHHHTIQMVQTLTQIETTTSQNLNTVLEDDFSSPELTINVIHDIHHHTSANLSQITNESSLNLKGETNAETGKNNKTGSNQNAQQNKTFITIVHNDKPLTSQGQVTYISEGNTSAKTIYEENNPAHEKNFNERETQQTQRQLNSHILSNHQLSAYLGTQKNKNQGVNKIIVTDDTTSALNTDGSPQLSRNDAQFPAEHSIQTNTIMLSNTEAETQQLHKNIAGNSPDSEDNLNAHEVLNLNVIRNESFSSQNINVSTNRPANKSNQNNTQILNNSISRVANQTNLNKNDTQLYIYHLLNKLEELSNQLRNSVSTGDALIANTEHPEESQESTEQDPDYSLPDSTFSSN